MIDMVNMDVVNEYWASFSTYFYINKTGSADFLVQIKKLLCRYLNSQRSNPFPINISGKNSFTAERFQLFPKYFTFCYLEDMTFHRMYYTRFAIYLQIE